MKNKYLSLSMLLVGVGVSAVRQPATAQLLTRAHTKPEVTADAQPSAVHLRSRNPRSLKKALTNLEKRFNVSFAYDEQVIAGHQTDVDLDGLTLEQALGQLLDAPGLRYQRVNGTLIAIQASSSTGTTAGRTPSPVGDRSEPTATEVPQVRRITGRVTDENAQGLPGANVIEKGTSNGATTDANGNFALNASDAATTLTISSVGYVSQDVTIGNRTTINVQLVPDNRTLDEVVVVSYGTVKRSNLTEAVSIINTAEAKKVQSTLR